MLYLIFFRLNLFCSFVYILFYYPFILALFALWFVIIFQDLKLQNFDDNELDINFIETYMRIHWFHET